MKVLAKKILCTSMALAIMVPMVACKKKNKYADCLDTANTFLEAAVSLDAKKIKKLSKNMEIEEDMVDALEDLSSNDAVAAVMEKASYEIDEDNIKEKKNKVTLPVTITMPDYEAAAEESEGDIDEFLEAIDSQKEKKYITVESTLKFSVDDDEYTLSNTEDFLQEVFQPIVDALSFVDEDREKYKDNDKDKDKDKDDDKNRGVPSAGKVGISLPTDALKRWASDGDRMKTEFEDAGYEVDLEYAENDIAKQVSQIENMINNGCEVLIITAIDGSALSTVLDMAKNAGIPVIAYDRLIMNTDAVTAYTTFDNLLVGKMQAEYIVNMLDLENKPGPFTLEIFAGDPGDNYALFFYTGAMEVLTPYIDAGKLIVPSGQISFDACATRGWSTQNAEDRMNANLSAFYTDTFIDAVLCSNDSTAFGVENALAASYTGAYPIITGQDCDLANMRNMLEGKQSMSIFKDTRVLADRAVTMATEMLNGEVVTVNDTSTCNNGAGIVPAFLCQATLVDVNNYEEILFGSGYYEEGDF